jgi:hypothetical protein
VVCFDSGFLLLKITDTLKFHSVFKRTVSANVIILHINILLHSPHFSSFQETHNSDSGFPHLFLYDSTIVLLKLNCKWWSYSIIHCPYVTKCISLVHCFFSKEHTQWFNHYNYVQYVQNLSFQIWSHIFTLCLDILKLYPTINMLDCPPSKLSSSCQGWIIVSIMCHYIYLFIFFTKNDLHWYI